MAASSLTEDKTDKTDKTGKKKSRVKEPSLNMKELRELADLVDEHGFTDFEFENEKIRVRLSKTVTVAAVPQTGPAPQSVAPVAQETVGSPGTSSTDAETTESDADDGLYKITSPIVGTFYSSPAPDKPAYIREGDQVSADTVVCIVEAMKLMNEIQAEVSGEVVKVYIENGQPVEYGQPLFGIKQ
jgi:acetyl-CoA carboxylase biotin carboxyl carrier protein